MHARRPDIYGAGVDPVLVRRRVGMVFQKLEPVPEVDLRERRLRPAHRRHEGSGSELRARVERALRQAALWDEVKDRLTRARSGCRAASSSACASRARWRVEPEVLLMDEPCSALDPIATAQIEELIHELSDDYTIVIVTHNMQQAARVSDYTAFFYMGELVEVRPDPRALHQARARAATEDYITGDSAERNGPHE